MNAPRMPPVTLGTIIENRTFELVTALSSGDLLCYRPISDHEGTDLIVKRRYRAPVLKVQVKGRTAHRRGGAIELGIKANQLPPSDPKCILVIDYYPGLAELGPFLWVIPSADFVRLASRSVGYYKSLLSPSPTANDRWVDYRYNTHDIAWVLTVLLEAQERGETLTTKVEVESWAKRARVMRRPPR